MALRINTNVASLAAQRHLNRSERDMEHALQAIASGQRIVKPGDDAAGLAISEALRGQVAGIRQARHNAENAVSLIQVAEGGLNEQNNILIRLRELGIQAASDTVSDVERGFLNEEYQQLTQEFDRIAQTTTFGNKKLLVGNAGSYEFHVGTSGDADNIITYNFDANTTASTLGVSGLSIDDQGSARDTLATIDEALQGLSAVRANFGAIQSRLQTAQSNLDVQLENLAAAKSRISDADMAEESGRLLQAQVLESAGIAVLAQSNNLTHRADRLLGML